MFLEVNPGTKTARRWPSPASRSRSPTRCPRSTSTRSSPRSTPTPAPTSTCSSTAPAQGLKGNGGSELAGVLERFLPTHRDLARLNSAVAVRGANLRRLVNSLQRLNTSLAAKQGQIVQLVDASSTVFRAFASQDAQHQPRDRRPPGHAAADDRDAGQGAGVRQPPRSDGHQPAARPRGRCRPPTRRSPRWPSRARRSSATRSVRS